MADTLPSTADCCLDCAIPTVTAIPGPQGDPCTPCNDGADGDNAWSLVDGTVPVAVPACAGSATIALQVPPGNAWMAVGQAVYISPYGYYEVTAVNVDGIHATVQNLCDGAGAYPDNIDGIGNFANGSKVSPAGIQGQTGATPANVMLKTENLSGMANYATCRTNLGLGTIATQPANNVAITGGSITGITDLAVADGGTGASAAAGARTNLGAAASGLATASGLTTSATDKVLGRSSAGAGAVEEIACTSAGRSLIDDASVTAMRTTLGVQRTLQDIIILRDQKVSGTDGGTFTNGAWRTRDLNTEVVDTGAHCTLAANQFTLADGVYRITAMAPGHKVDHHQIRLYDVVAASVVIEGGISAYGGNVDSDNAGDHATDSILVFRFTVSGGPRAYEIQHQCQTTRNTDGFGHASSFGLEVYTQVTLEREAG